MARIHSWASDGEFEALVAEARRGSRTAMGKLLQESGDYLLLVANRELGQDLRNKIGVSDVVQETFVQARGCFGQFRGGSERELLHWLRRILIRQILAARDRYQAAAKRSIDRERTWADDSQLQDLVAALPAKELSPSRQAEAEDDARVLAQAIAELPDDYREVLTLRYWERMTFAEIGERMNRSTDAAQKLWLRAVGRLSASRRLNDGQP